MVDKFRVVVECRHLDGVTLVLPCNWVVDGFCGVDGRKCSIRVLERIPSWLLHSKFMPLILLCL
jgi:hypothetical protein